MKIKKVFLFYPPGSQYQRGEDRSQGNVENSTATSMRAPNDMAYVSSQLEKIKIQNSFTDYSSEKKTLEDLIFDFKKFSPDAVITSTTTSTIKDDLRIINEMKAHKKDCIFIMKGSIFFKAPIFLLDSLDLKNIDFLIGGEIEFAAVNIINKINKNHGNFLEVPGIYVRENGIWKDSKFDNWNKEIDDLPLPNRKIINNSLYFRPDTGEPQATIATSRGCPSACVYCLTPTISGKKTRFRSPKSIIEELEDCYFNHGIKNFFFKSDTFTINHSWVKDVCDHILKSKLKDKIEWVANSRVRPLQDDTPKIMREAGCWLIAFGFETGSEETIKKIKKGATIDENLRAAKIVKDAGIKIYGFFLVGLPWEKQEHLNATEKHIFEINSDFIELHIAVPYYGTELYDIAKKEGLLKVPVIGQNYFEEALTGTKFLTPQQLTEWRKKILFKYHSRPSYIFSRFKESFTDRRKFLNYAKHAIKLYKNIYK